MPNTNEIFKHFSCTKGINSIKQKQQMNYTNMDLITYAYSDTTKYWSKVGDKKYPRGTNQRATDYVKYPSSNAI